MNDSLHIYAGDKTSGSGMTSVNNCDLPTFPVGHLILAKASRYLGIPGRYPRSATVIPNHLTSDARNCREAISLRYEAALRDNDYVRPELKTIVGSAKNWWIVLNMLCHEKVDWAAIGLPEARWATSVDGFTLRSGCINPINVLWGTKPVLVCLSRRVANSKETFATNNGMPRSTMLLTVQDIVASIDNVYQFEAMAFGRRAACEY